MVEGSGSAAWPRESGRVLGGRPGEGSGYVPLAVEDNNLLWACALLLESL